MKNLTIVIGLCIASLGIVSLQSRYIKRSPVPAELSSLQELRNQTNDTRYTTIQTNDEAAAYEMGFWPRQMSEHALFLFLGLEDAPLKKRAKELHEELEAYRKKMAPSNYNQILPLLKKLRAFKIDVLTELNAGKWIGWVYPQLVRHVTLELDYFVDKLNNIPYTAQQEINFWNIINDDHSTFSSHLLDPAERKLFDQANEFDKKYQKVESEDEMMLQISLKYAKELDTYHQAAEKGIKGNTIESIVHPALIEHVVREGQRSIEMLEKLVNEQTKSEKPAQEMALSAEVEENVFAN